MRVSDSDKRNLFLEQLHGHHFSTRLIPKVPLLLTRWSRSHFLFSHAPALGASGSSEEQHRDPRHDLPEPCSFLKNNRAGG